MEGDQELRFQEEPVLKRRRENKLNDLSGREWIKFQKSWFVHNPPPREKGVLLHPAKFPEDLVREFIEFFTKRGQTVLDPMVGTGSTLLSCLDSGRNGIGIELSKRYCDIARRRVEAKRRSLRNRDAQIGIIHGNALTIERYALPEIDYVITSPPYWDMLKMKGAFTQKERRSKGWDVSYSEDPDDLGNIADYEKFVDKLYTIFAKIYGKLRYNGYLTIIVKNVKKGSRTYPLAWDIGKRLSQVYTLKDEKIWCQDDQRLAPYGMYSAWVSNTFHHYCLNFRKEE